MSGIYILAATLFDWCNMRIPALAFAIALLVPIVVPNPGHCDNLELSRSPNLFHAVEKSFPPELRSQPEPDSERGRATSPATVQIEKTLSNRIHHTPPSIARPLTEPKGDSSTTASAASIIDGSDDKAIPGSYSEFPSPIGEKKKTFDFSKAVNLDKLPAVEGELTSYMGSYRINLKDSSRYQTERIIHKTREAIMQSGMRGAVAGTIAGALAALLAVAIRAAAYRAFPKHRKDQRREQSGSFVMSTAVVSLLIAFSVASVPIAQDTVRRIQTVDTPDYLRFTPVYSFEFGVRIEMPEPYRKYRIIHKAEDSESSAIFDTNSTPVPESDRTYYAIVHEEASGGMALGFTRMPRLPQAIGNKYYHYDIEKGLDAAARQAVKGINGEVSYICAIDYKGKHPGREAEGALYDDAGIFRQRLYITGSGNYVHAAVYGDPVWVNSNQAYKFLDSIGIRND